MKKNKVNRLFASILSLGIIGSVSLQTQNAEARVATEDMKDLRADHWAYNAIKELVDKYDIMSGFPDGTFRGARTFTRYEASAALYKIMLRVEEMMAGRKVEAPISAPVTPVMRNSSVSDQDLKIIKELTEEFRRELDAMKAENTANFAKIKTLQEELEKVKKDFGRIKFGGDFSSGFDDTIEDTFRPAYYASYTFDMNATVNDNASLRARFSGNFNSEVQEVEENGKKTKKDIEKPSLDFAQAWFNYAPTNTPMNPKVKFGYMGMGALIQAGTSVTHYFNSSTGLASPNINGGRKRGLRLPKTVVGGVDFGSGPFSFAVAASPNTIASQIKLDLGGMKIKFLADADQALFFGEYVQDPLHNEAVVVDFGNDNFGASVQANFRGVSDDWNFRAASGVLYFNIANFEVGGSAKFENEASQQIVAGAFVKTPDKWGERTIPSLIFTMQEPLTMANGSIFEGSNLGDKAGFNVSLSYDNPYVPGLSVYFDQKTNILFSDDPKDLIANTYGISASMGF